MSEAPHNAENETQAAVKPAFHLGGQALIEGVMMRSPHFIAASVRRADGQIETRVERFHSVLERSKWFRLPFVRGVIALTEMMGVGSRFLRWSSDLVMLDENAKLDAVKSEEFVSNAPFSGVQGEEITHEEKPINAESQRVMRKSSTRSLSSSPDSASASIAETPPDGSRL